MIKIERANCPDILANTPLQGTHYNKKEVVTLLWNMQKEKCCYCEQYIPEIGHLKAVEHFEPQSIVKLKRNNWNNLLLACAQCNGKKSSKFPVKLTNNANESKVIFLKNEEEQDGETLILDPSLIDPENHLDYDFTKTELDDTFGMIIPKNSDELGRHTIDVIGLDSAFYNKKRFNHYVNIILLEYRVLLLEYKNGQGGAFDACKRCFRALMSASSEFAGFVRSFARYKQLDVNLGINIPNEAEV